MAMKENEISARNKPLRLLAEISRRYRKMRAFVQRAFDIIEIGGNCTRTAPSRRKWPGGDLFIMASSKC